MRSNQYLMRFYGVLRVSSGGLGLSLLEAQVGKLTSGLVLIDDIFPGSNAEKAGGLLIGDALMSVASAENSSVSTSVEALNFDATLKELRRFSEYSDIIITVRRIVPRKEILVKMVGPQGNYELPQLYA